jgi:hypothetical protein
MLAEMGNGGMSKVADGVWRSCFWMSVMVMSRTTDDNNTGEGDGERKTVLVGVEFVRLPHNFCSPCCSDLESTCRLN